MPPGYGSQPGMMGAYPTPGMSQYPPSFSYGLQPTYGNMAGPASWALSSVGNVPSAMSTIGAAAGVGAMFTGNSALRAMSFFDPTTFGMEMGAARFGSMIPGVGMPGAPVVAAGAEATFAETMTNLWMQRAMIPSALGASAASAALPVTAGLAAMEAARYTGRQMMTGGREQLALGAQLSGLGFANPMAATGRGFGFNQQRQIGSMMREIDAADPFTTMRDLSGMMDQFTGMGMHRGVEDAREFSRKFKEFTGAVREIAKEMGTTLEDAGRVFGNMRQAGFYTANDVMGNTRSMRVASGMGMDQDTFMGMQAQGAGISRGALLSGRAGALTSSRFAQNLMMGGNDERLMDITGASTGAEAAAVLGGQFTSVMSNYLMNTAGGKAMLAGMGKTRNGLFTGEVDTSKFASGNVKLSQVSGLGRANLGSSARSRASFVTNQQNIASSLLESENGVDAVLSAIEQEAAEHFRGQVASDDAMKLFYEKQLGVDARFSETLVEMTKKRAQNRLNWMRKVRQEQAAEELQLDMARNYTVSGLAQQVGGGFSDLFSPVRQAGADVVTSAQNAGMYAMDSVMGISRSPMNDASVRASVSRLARGQASFGAATDVSLGDFRGGTAMKAMALGGAFDSGGGGAEAGRLLSLARRVSAGGDVGAGDIRLAKPESEKMDPFIASDAGQRASLALAKAQNAEALGDKAGAAAHMAAATSIIEGHFYKGYNQSTVDWERGHGTTDLVTAEFARRTGFQDLANSITTKGGVQLHRYEDAETLRKQAMSSLTGMGVSSELAEQLGGGGTGSQLFISLAKDQGLDYFAKLANRSDVKERLRGASADERFDILAEAASADRGGTFTGSDVKAVMQGFSQIEADQAGGFSLKGAMVSPWAAYRGPRDHSAALRSAGASAQVNVDSAALRGVVSSAADTLGGLSPEVRRALGGAYGKSLSQLRGISASSSGAQQAAAVSGLTQLLTTAGSSLDGVSGGEELYTLGQQYMKAMKLAGKGGPEGLKGIEELYGVTEDQLNASRTGLKLGGSLKDPSVLSRVVSDIASQDVLVRLGSGAGGGIERRGQTVEQRILSDMQRTSEQVQKTAVAITAMTDTLEKNNLIPKPAGT